MIIYSRFNISKYFIIKEQCKTQTSIYEFQDNPAGGYIYFECRLDPVTDPNSYYVLFCFNFYHNSFMWKAAFNRLEMLQNYPKPPTNAGVEKITIIML